MGIAAGTIDILPMIKMKIDKYSILSAFLFHLIAPFILYSLETDIIFWLKGGLVYLLLAIPTIVLVAKDDKKSVPIMCGSSLIIGTIIGAVQHFFM
jgi:hypothetical protein